MKVLVACEESQAVTKAFRDLGHEAYSCDLIACSGPNPEWHIIDDARNVINRGWDLLLAFPPCTHLANSGAKWFAQKRADGRQSAAIQLFMDFANARVDRIAIENPVGVMSTIWRKPNQIIQPYLFGDPFTKTTCLWLKNLPNLLPTNVVNRGERTVFRSGKSHPKWYADAMRLPAFERSKVRSKTFPGIAAAMAKQWSSYIESTKE